MENEHLIIDRPRPKPIQISTIDVVYNYIETMKEVEVDSKKKLAMAVVLEALILRKTRGF